MTLRSRGTAARIRRHKAAAGVSVTYARAGQSSLALSAWVGRIAFRSDYGGGVRVELGDRDYFVAVADLTLGTPRLGDRITETIGGTAVTFEVQTPETGEACWRYHDPDRTVYRLHCKRVTVIPDTTAPTLSSATVGGNGTTLTLVFSERVTAASWSGFALSGTYGLATPTYQSGAGTDTVTFTLSRTVGSAETVTLAYTPGVVEDLGGNDLAAFSGTAAANNSAQAGQAADPSTLAGLKLWLASSSGTYSDAGGTTPAATGQAIAAWRDRASEALLFGANPYAGGFFGLPTLRSDNGHPVVESRTTANAQASLISAPAASWSPTAMSVHWLAKMRPGTAEALTFGMGFNTTTGMKFGGIWESGDPILANNTPGPQYSGWCNDGGYALVSYVRYNDGAAKCRIYRDGVLIYDGADATTASTIEVYHALGWQHNDQDSAQYLADAWVYAAAHTDQDVSILARWCRQNRSLVYPAVGVANPNVFVYFIGNSIWTTAWTGFPSLPTRASTGQSEWSRWLNASLGGQATGGGGTSNGVGMIARLPEYEAILANRAETTRVAVIFEITNDMALAGATPAQAYTNYVTLAQGLKARGIDKVVAVTCLPRPQIAEVDRDAVNALVVGNAAGAWDAVCAIHQDGTIGVAGANANGTYYHPDQIHLRSAGADVFAPLLRATIEGVLP